MITAVDTNILLDVLIPGEPHNESSKALLDSHLSNGRLILCEVVFAELAANFISEQELKLFLSETGMRLIHSGEKALYTAGIRWAKFAKKHRKNRFACSSCSNVFEVACPKCNIPLSRRQLVMGDFLIGAHALVHADCLLTRDLGVYKNNFQDLKIIGSGD